MSDDPNPQAPPLSANAAHEDMRKQMWDLANRASRAGLVQVAFALEMAVVLLEESCFPKLRSGPSDDDLTSPDQ